MSQVDRDRPIRRVENPEPDTEERQEAAEVIEELWPTDATLTDMADESGYSRQHIVNVVQSHFQYVEEEDEEVQDVPDEILGDPKAIEAFRRGYEAGYVMGKSTKAT